MSVELLNIASPFPLSSIHLDEISTILAPMTVSSALVFNGSVDTLRFQTALRDMITYCPWLVCSYHDAGSDQIQAVPNLSGDSAHGSFVCEVDTSYGDQEFYQGEKASVNVADLLPGQVHIKMLRPDLALQSLEELPIAAFRLTVFQAHFVIGYRLNHAFYDQCAIVEFFNFLGDIYRHSGEPTGVPPRFYPRAYLVDKLSNPSAPFASEAEFLAAAPSGYTAESLPELSFGAPTTVRLLFDNARISDLRTASNTEFTSNDIMNAVLLKAVARFASSMEEGKEDSQRARVLFARNMRRQFDLGHEIVGDYVRLESLSGSMEDVRSASLVDLAQRNHQLVEHEQGKTEYPRECAWFKLFTNYRTGRPNTDFLNDRQTCLISNWSSFPYEHIHFDVSTVEELLVEDVPMMTSCGGFVHITFRGSGKHRQLIAILATQHAGFIEAVCSLGEESGLFHVQK